MPQLRDAVANQSAVFVNRPGRGPTQPSRLGVTSPAGEQDLQSAKKVRLLWCHEFASPSVEALESNSALDDLLPGIRQGGASYLFSSPTSAGLGQVLSENGRDSSWSVHPEFRAALRVRQGGACPNLSLLA